MAYLTLLVAVVLLFATAFFAVQNSTIVTVSLFFRTIEASLVIVILGAAALGFFTALFFGLFIQLKMRYRLYRANRRISLLEAELRARQAAVPEAAAPPAADPQGDKAGPE